MKLKLRLAAGAIAVVTLGLWFFGGMNLGWTKTSVTEWRKDPVTEIEGPVHKPDFKPGVDFLAGAFAAAGLLWGSSLLMRNRPT